jgi:hypothetical protein
MEKFLFSGSKWIQVWYKLWWIVCILLFSTADGYETLLAKLVKIKGDRKREQNKMSEELYIPSGGLTLIVGTQKWGFSCKVQRWLPAVIFLNEILPTKTPCGHDVHGHGSPGTNCWRFSELSKKYKTLTLTLKICILQEHAFKKLTLVLFESLFLRLQILLYNIYGQTFYWSTAKPWTSPQKKRLNDLKRSRYCQQVQSFVCVRPWRRVTFKFWKML